MQAKFAFIVIQPIFPAWVEMIIQSAVRSRGQKVTLAWTNS